MECWQKTCRLIFYDDDGWWAFLKPGYVWGTDCTSVFNGETWDDLVSASVDIHKEVLFS